jgi:hypothetical protein
VLANRNIARLHFSTQQGFAETRIVKLERVVSDVLLACQRLVHEGECACGDPHRLVIESGKGLRCAHTCAAVCRGLDEQLQRATGGNPLALSA